MTVLEPLEAGLATVMSRTKYFEVESDVVGTRFAVWVNLPLRYDAEPDRSFPVVYQPDGNQAAAVTPTAMLADDPICPIEPFIQVAVGYTGADARRMLAVRARDLLPPGEPMPPGVDESSMAHAVSTGFLSEPDAALYLHNLRNPAADRFLTFLTDELHPLICDAFRVDEQRLGLHGYSYGGLFAAWVAMQPSAFTRIGAGSPGILPDVSRVLSAYDENVAADADHSGRLLHVTVCEKELTVPSLYQHMVGAGTTQLLARLGATPLRGLSWSSRVIASESHATAVAVSYYDYLRACWPAAKAPS